jgi:hypothetical protein
MKQSAITITVDSAPPAATVTGNEVYNNDDNGGFGPTGNDGNG